MSWTVIEADGNGVRETRRGGTLTGETLAEVAEAKRDRAIAWADITRREIPAEMDGGRDTSAGGTQAGETEVEPESEPKPKLVTWRVCVRIQPGELDEQTLWFRWYPSGDIPEDWYPVESYTQPIETVQLLPEGEMP